MNPKPTIDDLLSQADLIITRASDEGRDPTESEIAEFHSLLGRAEREKKIDNVRASSRAAATPRPRSAAPRSS